MKRKCKVLILFIICMALVFNTSNLHAAASNNVASPSATELQKKTKKFTINLKNKNKSIMVYLYPEITGYYSLDTGTCKITDMTTTKVGHLKDVIYLYENTISKKERQIEIWCRSDAKLIAKINFKILSSGSMIISTEEHYGKTTIDLIHDFAKCSY